MEPGGARTCISGMDASAEAAGTPPDLRCQLDTEETDRLSLLLPLTHEWRPAWDVQVLESLGCKHVHSVEDLNARVQGERQQVLSRSTPMFMVCAEK